MTAQRWPLKVEAAMGADLTASPATWAWTDITTYVRQGQIAIRRGGGDPASVLQPCEIAFTLRDDAGRFAVGNAMGPYWPLWRLGTPVRVSAFVNGSYQVRGTAYVSSLERDWPVLKEAVSNLGVTARGLLWRLQQSRTTSSPLYAAIRNATTAPLAWWPLEDLGQSTQYASGLHGGKALTLQLRTTDAERPSPGAVTPPTGASAMPSFSGGGSLRADITGTSTTAWTIEITAYFGDAEPEEGTYSPASIGLIETFNVGATDSDFHRWSLSISPHQSTALAGGITLIYFDQVTASGSIAINETLDAHGLKLWDKGTHHFTFSMADSAGSTAYRLLVDGVLIGSGTVARAMYAVGPVVLNGAPWRGPAYTFGIGHLAFYDGSALDLVDHATAAGGYAGETAATRLTRLAAQNAIPVTIETSGGGASALGPQRSGLTFLEHLRELRDSELAEVYEARDGSLYFRPRHRRYNRTISLTADYDQAQVARGFAPTYDDLGAVNVATATRPDGSSAQHLASVVDPDSADYDPAAPVYADQISANVADDADLLGHAQWRVHLGWDQDRPERTPAERIPTITLDFNRSPSLLTTWLTCDIGSRIQIANPPLQLGMPSPQVSDQHIVGYVEAITPYFWKVEANVTPAQPWGVWELDSGGSTLVAAVTSSATSLKLATSSGPPWSTTRVPYNIQIDGEGMTVTAMATATPAFIAAGTLASGNNASVTPGLPAGMTPDTGQLMLCFAAIRNSGTGTVDLPAGWTSMVVFGNMRLFSKYYVTGDTAPTVTFSGGVANADTQARIFGFSGLSMHPDSAAVQLNGSTQNIAYPMLDVRRTNNVMIVAGWKQDDWASVATVSGFTADTDSPTITGDDQGIALQHRIDTTPTDLASGSLVVTGGLSAISRSIVVALRPLQTATVTRSVNGVVKAQTAGQAVHAWQIGVLAL